MARKRCLGLPRMVLYKDDFDIEWELEIRWLILVGISVILTILTVLALIQTFVK
jgi:hypothetical protein